MSNVLTLYHCSNEAISTIHDDGNFGSWLFFGDEPSHYGHVVHSLDIDFDEEVIRAGSIFYQENAVNNAELDAVVRKVMKVFGVDEDTADDLISERISSFDKFTELGYSAEDCANNSWLMQYYTACAAEALGFRGVAVSDEYGTSYMINMLGREHELTIETRNN
jgi:hypothetical protein